jgi:hypothetical protein
MAGRWKRKIEVDLVKAKEVKNLLKLCKNDIERKRITIMSVYLWWKDTDKTASILWVSVWTVTRTIALYIEAPEWFYKTSYKGKIVTDERKKLKEEVKAYVEKKIENMENIDINWVLRDLNKKNNKETTTYNWMRRILRKNLNYNYHKPFVTNQKQSEHAEKVVKWRLTKAILEVALEEKNIDAESIKNKKTKIGGNSW